MRGKGDGLVRGRGGDLARGKGGGSVRGIVGINIGRSARGGVVGGLEEVVARLAEESMLEDTRRFENTFSTSPFSS